MTLQHTITAIATTEYIHTQNHLTPIEPIALCDLSFKSTQGNRMSTKNNRYITEETTIFIVTNSFDNKPRHKIKDVIIIASPPIKASNDNSFFVSIVS